MDAPISRVTGAMITSALWRAQGRCGDHLPGPVPEGYFCDRPVGHEGRHSGGDVVGTEIGQPVRDRREW